MRLNKSQSGSEFPIALPQKERVPVEIAIPPDLFTAPPRDQPDKEQGQNCGIWQYPTDGTGKPGAPMNVRPMPDQQLDGLACT